MVNTPLFLSWPSIFSNEINQHLKKKGITLLTIFLFGVAVEGPPEILTPTTRNSDEQLDYDASLVGDRVSKFT